MLPRLQWLEQQFFFYFTECFLVHDLNKCTHLTAFATAWKLTSLSNIYQNVHLGKTPGLTSVLVYAKETLIGNDLINSVLFLPTQSVLSGSLQQGIGRKMNTGRKAWSSYYYCKLFIPKRQHSLFFFLLAFLMRVEILYSWRSLVFLFELIYFLSICFIWHLLRRCRELF